MQVLLHGHYDLSNGPGQTALEALVQAGGGTLVKLPASGPQIEADVAVLPATTAKSDKVRSRGPGFHLSIQH